jgi:3-oxoacyl-(acyl-carrier-protein) synthase
MIHAVAWFSETSCGVWTPDQKRARHQRAPALTATDDVAALIGRPVKYFSRMTADAQMCLCAAGLALHGTGWRDKPGAPEIGVLAAGYEGCLAADRAYFQDYLASGRKLGRASLFVYTLPTSAACAVSMTLALTGPVLHVHEDAAALESLARHAEQMLADREADAMLALWSDPRAAICLAVGAGPEIGYPALLQAHPDPSPWQLAQHLQALPSL